MYSWKKYCNIFRSGYQEGFPFKFAESFYASDFLSDFQNIWGPLLPRGLSPGEGNDYFKQITPKLMSAPIADHLWQAGREGVGHWWCHWWCDDREENLNLFAIEFWNRAYTVTVPAICRMVFLQYSSAIGTIFIISLPHWASGLPCIA